ncbi:hypothetical protein PHSC3_000065 [Chlamydiales bacterium STE3]|nr:hypothetical protein PHSC3_000065 [Chlamydiales bacterium STE3]
MKGRPFFLFFSFPSFKDLSTASEIDLASIYKLSVILAPITSVMHGFSLKRFGHQAD